MGTLEVWKVGVIGLGAMGLEMVRHMQAHPRFDVVAAWDPDEGAVARAREAVPQASFPSGPEGVLTTPGVALAYVASPPATHAGYAHRALDAGLALFCEKPLGVDLEASRTLARRIAADGAMDAVNFNHAAAFDAATAAGWLRDGELGSPCYVSMRLHLPAWPRPFQAHARWLAGRAQGGFSREVLSHWVFLGRRLLGDVEVRWARPRYPADAEGAETALSAELAFGGTPAFVTAAVGGDGPTGMEWTLYASRRSLRLGSGGALARWDGRAWAEMSRPAGIAGDRERALDEVAARLDGRPSTAATVADALAVQEAIEAMVTGV